MRTMPTTLPTGFADSGVGSHEGSSARSTLPSWLPTPESAKPVGNVVGMVLTEAALEVAWYWALMRLAGRPERFLQTTSAIFGVQVIVLAIALAILVLSILAQSPAEPLPAVAVFAVFGLRIWLLVLNVRIVQAATSWSAGKSVLSVLAQALLIFLVLMVLFPDAVKMFVPEPAAS
ncbi:MAG: hypothetical protein EOP08_15810 [Proteobacteria bacterium]|nr:MAG: hypothetical protein EOP08_15810 [Pseudomonadota bacterium]